MKHCCVYCGAKLSSSRTSNLYVCPYCGEEFPLDEYSSSNHEYVKKGMVSYDRKTYKKRRSKEEAELMAY